MRIKVHTPQTGPDRSHAIPGLPQNLLADSSTCRHALLKLGSGRAAAILLAAGLAGAIPLALAPGIRAAEKNPSQTPPPKPAPRAPAAASSGGSLSHGVLFKINGADIPRERFLNEMNEALGESYHETFIGHVLLDQKAKALGVTVPPVKIEDSIKKTIDQVREERFQGDASKLDEGLKEQGLTLDGWMKRLRVDSHYDLLAERVVLEERAVTDEDLHRAFEEKYGKGGEALKVRHVLKNIAIASAPEYSLHQYEQEKDGIEAEAKARAEEALAKIQNKETFDSVMTAYSDDPRKVAGGTLPPWQGRFGPDFDKAATALGANDISGVIKCNDGYRIVQCLSVNEVEEVHAQHILAATGSKAKGRSDADSRKKADQIMAEIRKGADFSQVARESSEDPASASRGGDLGFFARRAMVKPFEDAAFALEPGQVSEIVKSGFGYHIIKVLEKRKSEERKLRQILVSTQFPAVKERRLRPALETKARERLEAALAEIQSPGASFADVARKYSEDLTTKDEGGLFRPYTEGVYAGEFDEAVHAMKAGDPPRIVKDNYGNLHLLQVDGLVKTELGAVRDALKKELMERPVTRQEKADYIKKLRETAQVVY